MNLSLRTVLPDFGSEVRNQQAQFLKMILAGIIHILIPSALAVIFIDPSPWPGLSFLAAWFPIVLIIKQLLKRGYLKSASYAFCAILLVMVNTGSIFFGGVIGPNMGAYMAVPLIAGLILGIKGGVIFSGLSALSAVGLLWFEQTVSLNNHLPPAKPISTLVGLIITTGFMVILMYTYNRILDQSIKRTQANAEIQKELNQRLKAVQTVLEEKSQQLMLANQNLELRVSQRTREIEHISSMVQQLHACLTLENAYPVLRSSLMELFPGFAGRLWLLDEKTNTFTASLDWGRQLPAINHPPNLTCAALQQNQPVCHFTPLDETHCFQDMPGQIQSSVCMPLRASNATLGLLQLFHGEPMFGWQEPGLDSQLADFRRLAMTISHQISIALGHLHLHMELQNMAIQDELTGLYNRRFMADALNREISRAQRKNHKVGLAILDIDHFKQYNDQFGHDVGDEILKQIGAYFKTNLRKEDVACRLGGEEFLLIFPEISQNALQKRVEHMISDLRQIRIYHHDRELGTITVSAGASLYPNHGLTPQQVVRAADLALYQSKNAGRDRLTLYDPQQMAYLDNGRDFSSLSAN
ncbi:MAG: GGDEF domain-containing protein [Chloroflexi bacterium]|nr:GGDEF domain-containing protein [Chloroflexota bacterium]